MSLIRTRLSCLSKKDHEFLKKLVHFGGACTRWQAAIALGYKDKENTRMKLHQFVKLGLLKKIELNGTLPNGPSVYLPTRVLAQELGCDRREPRDTELLVEKCYRFLMAAIDYNEPLRNYFSESEELPVSSESLEAIKKAHRDEVYVVSRNAIVIDIMPTWSKGKAVSRVMFWARQMPKATLELYSTNPMCVEMLKADLDAKTQERITVCKQRFDPLCSSYARNFSPYVTEDDPFT